MIDEIEGEVFHHLAAAAILENLPKSPPGNAVKIGLVNPDAWR